MPAEGVRGLHHADDDVVGLFDVDRPSDRVLEGEQLLGGLGGQHAVVLLVVAPRRR